jgi:hypothetical protein
MPSPMDFSLRRRQFLSRICPVGMCLRAGMLSLPSESSCSLHTTCISCALTSRHFSRGSAVRATADDADALRHAKLNELHGLCVLRLRDDHARLMRSRAFPSAKPTSVDVRLRETVCPCGLGMQDRPHLLWHCQIPRVELIRRTRLLPACLALRDVLDTCEPVSGTHAVAHACYVALREQRSPRSGGILAAGDSGVVLTDDETAVAAERHLLGVIARPYSSVGLARALRLTKPVLVAVSDMLQACERATTVVVQRVFAQHRLCQLLRADLHCWRRVAFEERECLPQRSLQLLADVRRSTPRVRANTVASATPVAMVVTPWRFGGATIQRALQSHDPEVAVSRVVQQMYRVARSARARACCF